MKRYHRAWPTFCVASFMVLAGIPAIAQEEAGESGAGLREESIELEAADGGHSEGILYTDPKQNPKIALVTMHPRGDQRRHFVHRPAARAGLAGFGIEGRHVHREPFIIKEELLLDIAAGLKFLRSRGFEKIILVGHSGGGPLFGLYQAQAETAPPNRIHHTPAGDPPDLNKFDLPKADAIITLASHEGEGLHNDHRLDPSIIDEDNPYLTDPSLDMYNPKNGFQLPPESSTYSKEFLERFRAAQKARAQRLHDKAVALVEEQRRYQRMTESPEFKAWPLDRRLEIERRASISEWMIIYGTEAEPRYLDMSLDPSDRVVGSNDAGPRPDLRSRARSGAARVMTPQGFLSTRSGISSNANQIKNVARVTVPTLVVCGTADRGIYLSHTRAIYEASGARDKKMVLIEGADHGFRPSGRKAGKGDQRQQTLNAIFTWIKERF